MKILNQLALARIYVRCDWNKVDEETYDRIEHYANCQIMHSLSMRQETRDPSNLSSNSNSN